MTFLIRIWDSTGLKSYKEKWASGKQISGHPARLDSNVGKQSNQE